MKNDSTPPYSLYNIQDGILNEFMFVYSNFDKSEHFYTNLSTFYEIKSIKINEFNEYYCEDENFYINKKECIEDYLETIDDKRKRLSQELDTIKIYINKLNGEYNHYDILLNSLS